MLAVCLLLTSIVLIIPVNASGPKSNDMTIHIYLSPDPENYALEDGTLDINDWPLAKEWIDKWVTNPAIQLRSYTEMGMMEFDIYNARWPTGCPYHHLDDEYFDTCARCRAAREFRKAVAYLTNKEKYLSEYLKGYGYRLDFPIPPFQAPYLPDGYNAANPPYPYDPATAATVLYNAGFRNYDADPQLEWKNVYGITDPGGNDGTTFEELPAVKMWVRMDDPNRKAAGEDLATELMAQNIPVDLHVTERSTCYKNVMVVYDYNIYTGGWSLSTIPDTYYDLYSKDTYYYPAGWSLNYLGWCNSTFYDWAVKVKYPANEAEAIAAAKQCGDIVTKSVPCVWLWSAAAVKAYKTGWSGVVNYAGYGVDTYLTFAMMTKADDTKIDYGFKSDIEQLNVISSEWLWDRNVIGLMYEGLLGTNPFTLKPDFKYLANDTKNGGPNPEVTTWNNAGHDATELIFAIRTADPGGAWTAPTFHNATDGTTTQPRRAMTAQDVEFSIDYNYICGAGVSWQWTLVKDVHSTWVDGSGFLHVRMKSVSYWAVDWIGGVPVVNPDIWNNIPDTSGGDKCGWQPSTGPGQAPVYNTNWDKQTARLFDPADPASDVNGNGVIDLKEDGTGMWIYDSYTLGTSVHLYADKVGSYYLSEDYLDGKIGNAFHYGYGDVDQSARVDSVDLGSIARALLQVGIPTSPPPIPPWQWFVYNSWADLDKSGIVNTVDATTCAQNYGAIVG
jgi:hypothetical protein